MKAIVNGISRFMHIIGRWSRPEEENVHRERVAKLAELYGFTFSKDKAEREREITAFANLKGVQKILKEDV